MYDWEKLLNNVYCVSHHIGWFCVFFHPSVAQHKETSSAKRLSGATALPVSNQKHSFNCCDGSHFMQTAFDHLNETSCAEYYAWRPVGKSSLNSIWSWPNLRSRQVSQLFNKKYPFLLTLHFHIYFYKCLFTKFVLYIVTIFVFSEDLWKQCHSIELECHK